MADCSYSVPDKDVSGDNLYGPRICDQQFVDWAWSAYHFDYDWWQDGWGYDDCCNTDKPLARALSGVWALNYSSQDPLNEDWNENALNWCGRFVREQMDGFPSGYDLRGNCGSKTATTFGAKCTEYRKTVKYDCTHYKDEGYKSCREWSAWVSWLCFAWFWVSNLVCDAWGDVASFFCAIGNDIVTDKRIELYPPFFYNNEQDVAGRASTFVHECRHIDGKAHDADFPPGSTYGAGNSGADSSWDYDGAWKWQACWLSWYWATAQNSTEALREKARDDANTILLGAFATSPGIYL